ncbi:ELMO domain-containing protein 2 [Bulinus truncatus]|nr:ELMO domain-containing protein 2 [Bulinus truncatus]
MATRQQIRGLGYAYLIIIEEMLPSWLNEWWTKVYFILLRPLFKWLLRKITGQCELLRITNEESDSAVKIKKIESSLKHSSSSDLRSYATNIHFDIGLSVKKIFVIKNIVPEKHTWFETTLQNYLLQIQSYNKLVSEAEELRKIKYSSDDPLHEAKLLQLWEVYNDGKSLPGRIGAHWTELGFQGHDPSTDFRGMGILGLEQLLYFAKNYPKEARHVLSQSHHPKFGFSFAIVGINITEMGYSLLAKRKLRSHFYNLENREPTIIDFHQVYCHLLYEFTKFWFAAKPKDIMEFSSVRENFHRNIYLTLKSSHWTMFLTIASRLSLFLR